MVIVKESTSPRSRMSYEVSTWYQSIESCHASPCTAFALLPIEKSCFFMLGLGLESIAHSIPHCKKFNEQPTLTDSKKGRAMID